MKYIQVYDLETAKKLLKDGFHMVSKTSSNKDFYIFEYDESLKDIFSLYKDMKYSLTDKFKMTF